MNDQLLITLLIAVSPALLFIEPAVDVLMRRRVDRRLYKRTKNGGINAVSRLTWQQFEKLCAGYFSSKGYKVELCGQGGADGGRDLVLKKSGKRILVQCKHWKGRVGVAIVREMFGVMTADQFDQVIIVGTSGFTKEAWAWAKGKPIQLFDANRLVS